MSKYEKGASAERELIDMFYESGFGALRVAGSGASKHPSPDVLASNGNKTFAIECKSVRSDTVYIPYSDVAQLVTFSQKFGAVPYVGVRFEKKDWIFLDIAKIKTTKGKNFKVSKSFAYKDGKRFEELVGKYTQVKL